MKNEATLKDIGVSSNTSRPTDILMSLGRHRHTTELYNMQHGSRMPKSALHLQNHFNYWLTTTLIFCTMRAVIITTTKGIDLGHTGHIV